MEDGEISSNGASLLDMVSVSHRVGEVGRGPLVI